MSAAAPSGVPVRADQFWDDVRTGPDGLCAVVAQDAGDGRVLMLAWADREALRRTAVERRAWFWSRSRRELWRKGDTSGNAMAVVEVRWDCDADAVLYLVAPSGPACHTGAATCFYRGERGEVAAAGRCPPQGDRVDGAGGGLARAAGGMDRPRVPEQAVPEAQRAMGPGETTAGSAGAAASGQRFGAAMAQLCAIVAERQAAMPEGSYVATLLQAGRLRALQKMGEEAVEAVIAGAAGGDDGTGAAIGEFADLCFHMVVAMAAAGIHPGAVAAELHRRHALRPPRGEDAAGPSGSATPLG